MQTYTNHVVRNIHHITLNRRHPAISVEDLVLMLEIDFLLGRRDDAHHRIRRALEDAYRQGRLSKH